MNFQSRKLFEQLMIAKQQYPVITVTGPRQSGKTTLVKEAFKDKPYVNLELPDLRAMAVEDPRYFLGQYPKGVIIDEVQYVPELLSYIQAIVDEQDGTGLYVLTGGQNFQLSQAITQSLAGRSAVFELLPYSINEMPQKLEINTLLYTGFYPRIYTKKINPTQFYRQYVQTYLEKDIAQMTNVHNKATFHKFMKLCAGRVGQLLNYNSLANDLGVSVNTIKSWLNLLEASYVVFRLQPYHANISKRLIKSPKLYFTDVGLVSYLLGIEDKNQLVRDPLRGNIFENMVVIELVKARYNRGLDPNLYFYRDSAGNEVDVLYQKGSKILPIEIKSAETFHSSMLRGIMHVKKVLSGNVEGGALIYSGDVSFEVDGISLANFKGVEEFLA